MSQIVLIVAYDLGYGIGNKGELLYSFPSDMLHFRSLTTGHPVVMGRKTWDSLPKKLPNRKNIVISTSYQGGADMTVSNIQEIIESEGTFYIIGGASIYSIFFPYADIVEVTEIQSTREADTNVGYFAEELRNFNLVQTVEKTDMDTKTNMPFLLKFQTYHRK